MIRTRGAFSAGAGPSKASSQTLCQKCLKRDDYECKTTTQERPYASRPSRTQQLANPKLVPQLTSDVPNDLLRKKGIADELLGKKAEERGRKRTQDENDPPLGSRKRSRSSHSSTSVSTISTNLSRSRSPSPRRSKSHRDDAYHTSQRTTSKPPFLKDATRKRQRSSSSSAASYSSGSSAERPPASRHNVDDRNTRRRRSSISPDARGRDRDFYRKRGNRRSSSRNNSMDRSKVARNRNSMTPGIMNSNHDRHNEGRSQHVRDHERRYSNDNERYGRRDEKPAQHAPPPPPIRKERSLSPFSKRLALTQAMNMGR